jgi:hypothetical protein
VVRDRRSRRDFRGGDPGVVAAPIITGGSTDPGNKDKEEACEYEGEIANNEVIQGDKAKAAGDDETAANYYSAAQTIVNDAEDNGCFFTGPF